MKRVWFPFITGLLLVFGGSAWALNTQSAANDPTFADFQKQVSAYAQLRKEARKGLPKAKKTAKPEEIKQQEEAWRVSIQQARKDAREGDFFPKPVAEAFKTVLHSEFRGTNGKFALLTVKESNPGPFECRINAAYPEAAPVSTVPPQLLLKLPQLPDYLEYRFVGPHLILRDTEANMIVDCLRNVIG